MQLEKLGGVDCGLADAVEVIKSLDEKFRDAIARINF